MSRVVRSWRWVVLLGLFAVAGPASLPLTPGPALAQEAGQVPGEALGGTSDAEIWRAIRQGEAGSVPIPDQGAARLIQSEGEDWRAIRNGPLAVWGGIALVGIVGLLALFFALRGRIRIEEGPSGHRLERFNFVERFAHWLTASCFVVLAVTGLTLLYGRDLLMPLIGREAFALIAAWGKVLHNYLAFGFMVGLLLMIVLWVHHNFPNRHDVVWLAKGGGMLVPAHVPARKFNAGQKILFWLVVLGGISVSWSGVMLLFPFTIESFGPTFALINAVLGTELPAELAPLQEQQLAQVWHAIMGLFLTVVIIGHIYIGTLGMEGAFDAMGSGRVDENWAREHHDVWVRELERKGVFARPEE